MRFIISSDSTCDLSPEQIRENHIFIKPLIVNMGNESYRDGELEPQKIYDHVAAGNPLCTTSAIPVGEYEEHFTELLKQGLPVIHRNLSTGHGLVVLEACRLAQTETHAESLCEKLRAYTARVDASFLLDRLDYMVKGGRCSMVKALGANLLRLKPCIEVIENKMAMGKKYRGTYAKSIEAYVRDRLAQPENLELYEIFITRTKVDDEIMDIVRNTVKECANFENIYETVAGASITCHCGEGTLGILYVRKQ